VEPKDHFHGHNLPLELILNQMKLVHILKCHFFKVLVHLHSHLYARSTPLYSGGTWYMYAYRLNIRSGFCVSPGKYQDCFLPRPLQLFTG